MKKVKKRMQKIYEKSQKVKYFVKFRFDLLMTVKWMEYK